MSSLIVIFIEFTVISFHYIYCNFPSIYSSVYSRRSIFLVSLLENQPMFVLRYQFIICYYTSDVINNVESNGNSNNFSKVSNFIGNWLVYIRLNSFPFQSRGLVSIPNNQPDGFVAMNLLRYFY